MNPSGGYHEGITGFQGDALTLSHDVAEKQFILRYTEEERGRRGRGGRGGGGERRGGREEGGGGRGIGENVEEEEEE